MGTESFLVGSGNWEDRGSQHPQDEIVDDEKSENSLLVDDSHHEPIFPSQRGGFESTIIHRDELEKMIRAVNGHGVQRTYEMEAFLQDKMKKEMKLVALQSKNSNGLTALFWAIRNRLHCSTIKLMLDIGGKELVMQTNPLGENSLHYAAFCGSSHDVFETLVEVGGKEALLQQDRLGNTPLHYAYCWVVSNRTKAYLTKKGGKDVLLRENKKKQVPFLESSMKISEGRKYSRLGDTISEIGGNESLVQHTQCQKLDNMTFMELIMLNQLQEAEKKLNDTDGGSDFLYQNCGTPRRLNCLTTAIWLHGNASPRFKPGLITLIKHMVEAGGKKLVLMKNNSGSIAVHYATFNQMPLEIIQLLVETAGHDVIHMQNKGWGNTPLHDACLREAPEEVIEYLVKNQVGTKALLALNNEKMTPLDLLLNEDTPSDSRISALQRAWYERDKDFAQTLTEDVITKILLWEFEKDDNTHLISNSFVKSILNQMFIQNRFRIVVMIDFYVQIAILYVYTTLSNDKLYTSGWDEGFSGEIVVLIICSAYLLGRELIQIFSSKIERYLTEYDNYVDIFQIVLLIWSVLLLTGSPSQDASGDSLFRYVMIGATCISWLELLFVIGQLCFSVSVFTSALVQIIVELVPFALTSALLILSFAQMYYISGVGGKSCDTKISEIQPSPSPSFSPSVYHSHQEETDFSCSKRGSYFQAFAMLLTSDFAFLQWDKNLEDEVNVQQIIVSILFALIVGILLLNILIGIVSTVFEEVKAKSENAFWSTRLDFMVEISVIRTAVDADEINLGGILAMTSREDDTSGHEPNAEGSNEGEKTSIQVVRRKSFAKYDDDWMRTKCSDKDMEAFFKWWYYPWRADLPSVGTRLGYFYRYASPREIILPGDVFINILFGFKYDYRWKCQIKRSLVLIISYIHFLVGIVLVVVVFVLGLFSFGFLWPTELKKYLFYGPVQGVKDAKEDSGVENLKTEIYDMKQQNVDLKIRMSKTQKEIATLQEQNAQVLTILTKMQRDSSLMSGFN